MLKRLRLRLTAAGQRVLAPLERRSRQQVRALLGAVDAPRREALLAAMGTWWRARAARQSCESGSVANS